MQPARLLRTGALAALLLPAAPLRAAADWQLTSPDGKLNLHISATDTLTYSLSREGRTLIEKSPIGLVLENGHTVGIPAHGAKARRRTNVTEHISATHYRVPQFSVTYNEVSLRFSDGNGVTFRAYNEGVAYRFYTAASQPLVIRNEIADMRFSADYPTYRAYSTVSADKGDPYCMAFQNLYTRATLTRADTTGIAFLPVTVDYGNGLKATLLEADLEAYPGMFVKAPGGRAALCATFAPYPAAFKTFPPRAMKRVTQRAPYIARVEGKRTYPWRIWAVTARDADMPLNHLVYALAAPNRIGDTSWIQTGKVAWDWWNDWGLTGVDFKAGINMDTYRHYIDFAAENGLEFIVLDEGWYDPAGGDMLTPIAAINLEELVAYGRSKGVGIILWTVFNVLDDQLEAACSKYAAMGIKGFKVDFLDRDDQTAVEMAYRIAEAAARHKLTLDYHGFYKPTGLNRTFPNIINFEAVFGMEEVKWSTVEKDMMAYDVTMPYIRMMAGPVDYTPGAMRNASRADFKPVYRNPMSQGTRCHQLAAYIIHDSPLTMLADAPSAYRREPECTDFIAAIPTDGFRQTRVLQGELGAYIVTARQTADGCWYVGGMTDWTPRNVTLHYDFLDEGTYQVTLMRDGENADEQAQDYRKTTFRVTPQSATSIPMASGGGFALRIEKL